jgi:hypothetical protein
MQFLRNLKLWQKLTLTALMLLVPVVLLAYFFWESVEGQAAFAQTELDGVDYYGPLQEIVSAVQARNFSIGEAGSSAAQAGIAADDARIDKEVLRMDELNARYDAPASPSSKLWLETKAQWKALQAQAPAPSL